MRPAEFGRTGRAKRHGKPSPILLTLELCHLRPLPPASRLHTTCHFLSRPPRASVIPKAMNQDRGARKQTSIEGNPMISAWRNSFSSAPDSRLLSSSSAPSPSFIFFNRQFRSPISNRNQHRLSRMTNSLKIRKLLISNRNKTKIETPPHFACLPPWHPASWLIP